MTTDDRTTHLNLPKPNAQNFLSIDVERIRSALDTIDSAVYGKTSPSDVSAAVATAITALAAVASSGSYNDLTNKPTIPSAYTLPTASATVLGGVKVGANLSIDAGGILSATGGAGQQAFSTQVLIPSSAGQTVFTVPGGYTVGQIIVWLNGSALIGGGDDYTATNGTTVVLTTGVASTSDRVVVAVFSTFQVAGSVSKTGDTMSGALNVPAGATGTQVPQAQEVVAKAGDTMTGALTLSGVPSATLHAATKGYVDARAVPSLSVVSGTSQVAAAGVQYALTNAAATTVTLPVAPTAGDLVCVLVCNGRTDNVIARNGKSIQGLAEDMTIDSANGSVWLRYINDTIMWRLI